MDVSYVDLVETAAKHQDAISLVIFDMLMPRMKGRALYEAICKINPHIKMIFMSGYSARMLNLNEMLGAQLAFIPKPFSKGALLGKIRSIHGGNCRS